MILLFPADPLNTRAVDSVYEAEAAAAEALSIPYRLFSYETLLTDPERAVRHLPSAADAIAVERVTRRFIELQGDDLSGGLVFREFIAFEPLTTHAQSGMPLTKEFRLFWLDGEPLYTVEYWEEGDYGGIDVPVECFRATAQSIRSRFFTMDVAKRCDGDWLIVELGDAQVAGLPDHADRQRFYQRLQGRFRV